MGTRLGGLMPEGGGAAYLRDTTVYAILKQNPYNISTNTLKAYLSAKPSSLSAFMISKTHIGAQEPRERHTVKKLLLP